MNMKKRSQDDSTYVEGYEHGYLEGWTAALQRLFDDSVSAGLMHKSGVPKKFRRPQRRNE